MPLSLDMHTFLTEAFLYCDALKIIAFSEQHIYFYSIFNHMYLKLDVKLCKPALCVCFSMCFGFTIYL